MRSLVLETAQKYLRFVKSSGPNNIGGPCPFHKGGNEKDPSFYMNLENGLYFCHSCHAKGTLIQFLRHMGAPSALIDASLELHRRQPKETTTKPISGKGEHFINEGLLGVFQYCPTDLVKAGFDKKLLEKLEIGFDREEMRITFPIRDLYGNLIGISGRTVLTPDRYNPRYKVYKSGDFLKYASDDAEVRAKYEAYDIKNHNFIWNMHNVYPEAFYGELDTVVVVEGYKACIWMIQQGIDNTVALQGSRLTVAQETILSSLGGTVILFLDNNQAGLLGALDAGRRLLKRGIRVLVVTYPEDCNEKTQPDNLDQPDILGVLDAANSWHQWRLRNHVVLREAEIKLRTARSRLHN